MKKLLGLLLLCVAACEGQMEDLPPMPGVRADGSIQGKTPALRDEPSIDRDAGTGTYTPQPSSPVADAGSAYDAGTSPQPQPPPPPPPPSGGVEPPLGGSSGGSGGSIVSAAPTQAGNVNFLLDIPGEYNANQTWPLLLVYSGTERQNTMMNNLLSAGPYFGVVGYILVVLDGVTYRGNGQAGATALDYVRQKYNIDNDRTYLLGESAGTSAALQLGFHLRQSYFAAYWANDVNATSTPAKSAADLGFAPWGQVGPGGAYASAQAIAAAMKQKGYRMDATSPYAGQGASKHGDPNQFYAALRWLTSGKTRK